MSDLPDPFREPRRTTGVLGLPTDNEVIPLILRHEDVRKAAKDWQTFNSDAPFRVPIPSEEHLRSDRVCPVETDVHGLTVKAGDHDSLCWASANLDETVFESADTIRLDRRPNPHGAFGFGGHLCLGASHARTVMRTLLECLCTRIGRIELVSKRDRIDHTAAYDRQLGYEELVVRMQPLA